MAVISEMRRLLDQARYSEVLALGSVVASSDPEYDGSVLLTVRAAVESGRFREAVKMASMPLREPAASQVRLWQAFAALFTDPQSESATWGRLKSEAKELANSADLATQALAADILGRGMAVRVAFGREAPSARQDALESLRVAESKYRAAGAMSDARQQELRIADFLASGTAADRVEAYQHYAQIAAEAEEPGVDDLVTFCNARLALLERDWEQHLSSAYLDADPSRLISQVHELSSKYATAGHITGSARGVWALAKILLKYGLVAGVELARHAANELQAVEERATQLGIWQELHLWHTLHGEPAEAQAARERCEALNLHLDLPFAAAGDEVAFADSALRAGRYGEAETRLRTVLSDPAQADLHRAVRQVLASVLSRSGRVDDAVVALSNAIQAMPAGDPFLAEALLARATLLYTSRPSEADADFEQLLSIAADPSEEARFRTARGWVRADHRRRQAISAHFDDAVLADFRSAEALLARLRTLAARQQLGILYRQWGQAAYAAGDRRECGRLLTASEEVFRTLGLQPDLAITLVHQGLTCVDMGRKFGGEFHKQAIQRFAEAEELFGRSGMTAMVWNAIFYQGIASREEGSNRAPGDERERLLQAASDHFERASRVVDVERGTLTERLGRDGQQAGAVFVRDKQELYREGFQLASVIRPNPVDAVRWLERMKGRAMLDILAATLRPPPALEDHPIVAQDMNLREQKKAAVRFDVQHQIHDQIIANLEAMASHTELAGYAAMRRTDTLAWPDIRALLRSSHQFPTLVILFAVENGRVQLFGLRADWESPRQVRIDIDIPGLEAFGQGFSADGNGGKWMKDHQLDQKWAGFAALVAPVAGWSTPGDPIVLVPHRYLHNLPLHLLPVQGSPLVDRHPVTYAPSASVWCHTLLRLTPVAAHATVFGDPTEDRPAIREAAGEMAQLLGGEPVLGPAVTRERLLEALASSRPFVYVGHGEFDNADGLNAGLRLSNGVRVTAADVLELPRTPALVVLAGCVTGVSQQQPGDELTGLVPALLMKDTRVVIASQWKVPATSTAVLVQEFARRWTAGTEPITAFRQAVQHVRQTPGWIHPYYWAGFTIHGSAIP